MHQESFKTKAKRFIGQCIRVLKITRKPDRQEFVMLVRVSAIGIAFVGTIGFLLFMAWNAIF